jgi:hypothetical protein
VGSVKQVIEQVHYFKRVSVNIESYEQVFVPKPFHKPVIFDSIERLADVIFVAPCLKADGLQTISMSTH